MQMGVSYKVVYPEKFLKAQARREKEIVGKMDEVLRIREKQAALRAQLATGPGIGPATAIKHHVKKATTLFSTGKQSIPFVVAHTTSYFQLILKPALKVFHGGCIYKVLRQAVVDLDHAKH